MTPDNIILSKTNNIEKEMYNISVALRSQSQEKKVKNLEEIYGKMGPWGFYNAFWFTDDGWGKKALHSTPIFLIFFFSDISL